MFGVIFVSQSEILFMQLDSTYAIYLIIIDAYPIIYLNLAILNGHVCFACCTIVRASN